MARNLFNFEGCGNASYASSTAAEKLPNSQGQQESEK